MKKIIYLILALFLYNISFSQGFSYGGKIDIVSYKLNGRDNINSVGLPIYVNQPIMKGVDFSSVIMVSYDFRIKRFNDELALGVSLNLGGGMFGIGYLEGLRSFMYTLPEYVMIYSGYNATKASLKDFGFAFGIGYEYTHMALPYQSLSFAFEVSYPTTTWRISVNPMYYTYYELFDNSREQVYNEAISLRNTVSFSFFLLIGKNR